MREGVAKKRRGRVTSLADGAGGRIAVRRSGAGLVRGTPRGRGCGAAAAAGRRGRSRPVGGRAGRWALLRLPLAPRTSRAADRWPRPARTRACGPAAAAPSARGAVVAGPARRAGCLELARLQRAPPRHRLACCFQSFPPRYLRHRRLACGCRGGYLRWRRSPRGGSGAEVGARWGICAAFLGVGGVGARARRRVRGQAGARRRAAAADPAQRPRGRRLCLSSLSPPFPLASPPPSLHVTLSLSAVTRPFLSASSAGTHPMPCIINLSS